MITALFCAITQHALVTPYRRFEKNYRSRNVGKKLTHYTLQNSPEQYRSPVHFWAYENNYLISCSSSMGLHESPQLALSAYNRVVNLLTSTALQNASLHLNYRDFSMQYSLENIHQLYRSVRLDKWSARLFRLIRRSGKNLTILWEGKSVATKRDDNILVRIILSSLTLEYFPLYTRCRLHNDICLKLSQHSKGRNLERQ
jgi:hypothetical protein